MQDSKELSSSAKMYNPALSLLVYVAQVLTVFLTLAIIAGRIYTQSYWNVFALTPDYNNIPYINYAIASPDVAVASIFIAVGTVAMIIMFIRQQPCNIVGNLNPRVAYGIGLFLFFIGIAAVGLITKMDLSSWAVGTVGLTYGVSYIVGLVGILIVVPAALKVQEEPKHNEKLEWLRKIPRNSILTFLIAALVIASLLGIFETAWQFGSNEAKFMYNTKPIVSIQLDSQTGFEDFISITSQGAALLKGKIIKEDSEFLYVSPGITKPPQRLYVLAIPLSRVRAIQYELEAPPIGK